MNLIIESAGINEDNSNKKETLDELTTKLLLDLIKEHYPHFYEQAKKETIKYGFSLDEQRYIIVFGETEETFCRISIQGIELMAFIWGNRFKEIK